MDDAFLSKIFDFYIYNKICNLGKMLQIVKDGERKMNGIWKEWIVICEI